MKKIVCLLLSLSLIFGMMLVPNTAFASDASSYTLTFDDWESVEGAQAKAIIDLGGQPTGEVKLTENGRNGKAIIFSQPALNSKLRLKGVFSNLAEGDSFTITLWAKSVNGKKGEISLGVYRDSNANPAKTLAKSEINGDQWTKISANFNVTTDYTDVTKIGIIQSGTEKAEEVIGEIMVDDISIVKAEILGKEDTNTPRITGITFDKWDSSVLQSYLSTGGSQPYEEISITLDEYLEENGASLKVGGRKNTYDRAKLVRVAKSAALGNEYKYSAYVKIANDANLDSANIVMGVADLNKTDPVYSVEKAINKTDWTYIEFTYTLQNENEDSISFEQKKDEKTVLTEYLVDNVTVECLKRVPTMTYKVNETANGYEVKATLNDYFSGSENAAKSIQTIVVKYKGNELLAAKMGEKKAFDNNKNYPVEDIVSLETEKLNDGEYLKVYSMSDVDENLPILASYKYNPFDPAFNQKTLYLIGDSIVCDYSEQIARKPDSVTRGWGMYIQQYFNENDIKVVNQAKSGESTKSFLYTNVVQRWVNVKNNLEEGDYVIICLGINDFGSKSPTRKVTVEEYKKNLQTFIDEISARGGKTILLTLTTTLNSSKEEYAKNGNFRRSMADAMLEVANNNKDNKDVYCYDLNQYMLDEMLRLIEQNGYDQFKSEYFADNTHQTEKGSKWVLSLIIDLIKNSDCPLKDYIK